jgi:hypothetical protein
MLLSWSRMILLATVLGALALGIGWAEQSNGEPSVHGSPLGRKVRLGTAVEISIDAVDPDHDGLRFLITAGRLPPGLSLASDSGDITGIATGPLGSYTATVTVSDGRGGEARSAVVLTVVPGRGRG